ncbi:DNA/RNA non-specific endonuclease [Belnapia sp. T18]|uniref:DNA/RNA non-specific endonuclease n=1 Tax=Belnapia arida TaxID=2804533 RepID=A0ABS1U9I9_9PROT|nr:DNA/RNA non-specific endonuclease [Belnapia arida]MBL6081195.1 DNA/RNA non-specific endonuclease [Belnapia arida]
MSGTTRSVQPFADQVEAEPADPSGIEAWIGPALHRALPPMATPMQPQRMVSLAAEGGIVTRFDVERTLGTNDLVGIEFLERGLRAARAVTRVLVSDPAEGMEACATGFMVSPRLLLTNAHVLPSKEVARSTLVEFGYELDSERQAKPTERFRLMPEECFIVGDPKVAERDFALVAVAQEGERGGRLARWGWLRLDSRVGKVEPGEWVTIIQHPGGAYKQVALRENQLIRKDDTRGLLFYKTDTAPGSSGAACFNDQWQAVALHSRGVPEMTEDGLVKLTGERRPVERDAIDKIPGLRDTDILWESNLGVRISRIVQFLRGDTLAGTNTLVRAMLADIASGGPSLAGPPLASSPVAGAALSLARVEESLASLAQQIGGDFLSAEEVQQRRRGSTFAQPRRAGAFPEKGYDPDFLGTSIPLPALTPRALSYGRAAVNSETGRHELPYTHFSIIMNAERRLAFATAVNIDGRKSFPLSRGRDRWTYDPRLPEEEQAGDWLYKEEGGNFFDRGHLVRRLDPCWGTAEVVERANIDTFHWTNCSPQHWSFNQGELLWNGLENYILNNTDSENILGTVFTGPVFRQDDYVHRGVPLPRDYWKVVVIRTRDGDLRASGYTISQARLVANIDFEEYPVGQFRTFQRPLRRIAEMTGLGFDDAVMQADVLSRSAGGTEGVGPETKSRAGTASLDARELLRLSDLML